MLQDVATSKSTKRSGGKRLPPASPTESYAEVGRRAAREAQRVALLGALVRERWNLSAVAESLAMGHPSNVLRAIRDVGLSAEYKSAKLAKAVYDASKD